MLIGLFFLDKWIEQIDTTNPFYINADDYAHLYEAIGPGYDWLYNYQGFTKGKKTLLFCL